MEIVAIPAFNDNYIWLIINKAKNTAICVDPGDAEPVLAYLQKTKLGLSAILLTHHHSDHIAGVKKLSTLIPKPLLYGPLDARIDPQPEALFDKDKLILDFLSFEILATPGHTATHISFFEPSQKWLFCGDTLFSGGCGRVFDGSHEQLLTSLNKFKHLPEKTKVFCAHEYTAANLRFAACIEPHNKLLIQYQDSLKNHPCSLPSTIALEKQINPFLRLNEASIQAYVQAKGGDHLNELAIFKQLRNEKDCFI